MSDDDSPVEPDELLARVTTREFYLLPGALSLGLVAGLWFGLWMVPDEALKVPTETNPYGEVNVVYHPVPGILPLATALLLAFVAYCVWQASQEPGGRWAAEESGGEER